MTSKISLVAGFAAILALSTLTQAQTAPPKIDNTALGMLEGSLAFCAKMDPGSASAYQERSRLITKDQPDKIVAEMRKSKEYQDAFDGVDKQLKEIAPGEAIKQCKAAIAETPASSRPGGPAQGAAPAKPNASSARPAPVWRGAQANQLSRRAETYYQGVWGVGELHVKVAESGELIRFNYQVFDPAKAAALNDKNVEPELYDAQARVKLSIPQLEKVGKLRQESTAKAGMTYWMAFSNPTLAVKRGHRVDVVIGSFHATNLLVE